MTGFTIPRFPTPAALGDDRQCRRLSLPDDPQWLGVYNAALLLLADVRLWEQVNDTDMTPAAAAAFAATVFEQYVQSGRVGACDMPTLIPPEIAQWSEQVAVPTTNVGTHADRWYKLLFHDIDIYSTFATHNAGTGVFTLTQGVYHITVTAANYSGGRSQIAFTDMDLTWQYPSGVQSAADIANYNQWVVLGDAAPTDFLLRQWFELDSANGRVRDGPVDLVVRRVIFERYSLLD